MCADFNPDHSLIPHRFVALARAFLAANEPDKLYQFLQNRIMSDSDELAELLAYHGMKDRALLQAGLDMYIRLGAITPLVKALLSAGEVCLVNNVA